VKTKEYGEQYSRPPPDLIDDEQEYEIEMITKSRKQDQGFAYCVKWKGYPDSENKWIPLSRMSHAMDLVREFHRNNKSVVGPPQESLRLMQIYCTVERKWQKKKINTVQKSQTTQKDSRATRK
jgi:sucrose-6-phosphate hydrolase SacC (GH32 family)